jgi:hypothetical protein
MHRAPDSKTRSRGKTYAAIGALLLVAVAVWFLTEGPGQRILSPPGSTVAEFEGSGNQSTPAFKVREGWQIHWDSQSETFSLAIRGDRDFGTVVEVAEPTSGITAPVGAGSFYLEVTAGGEWSITVVQGH